MPSLVTGGAGFLGSHLCERLVKQGEEVICLDNFFTGRRKNIAHLLDYKNFEVDLKDPSGDLDTDDLMNKAKTFFRKNGLLLNWREFEKLDKAQKINTLSMISPVTNEEKQKLLEAITIKDKVKTLESIISFYLHEVNFNNQTVQ